MPSSQCRRSAVPNDDEARLNWCTLYCAMYVFSVLQYIPCYAHGGVARLTGNLKQIYNQITMLCNKYTYIYRTTQGHTITTQPQYTEDTRHQTYQSHIPPSPYWSNLFCARSSVRPAVAARQSIRLAVACRTADLRNLRPSLLPAPPLRHGEGGP